MRMSTIQEKNAQSGQKSRRKVRMAMWLTLVSALFFSRDTSPAGAQLRDIQRRACWVALALLLQCLNEIVYSVLQTIKNSSYNDFSAFLKAICIIVPILLIVGSFLALWMAFRSVRSQQQMKHVSPTRWQYMMLVMSIALACAGVVICCISISKCFAPLQFSNDGTVFDTNAAVLLLKGEDPYSHPALSSVAQHHEDWTTPLRLGQFKGMLDYPTSAELDKVLNDDLKTGKWVEFESKVSYPAFSFLTLVPLVLVNDHNVLPVYLLSHLVLIGVAWKLARRELRPWILLLAFANIALWTATAGETLDMLYTLFVALTWLYSRQRWWSVLFFGLALASKQIAWYFAPFYFLMLWRQYNLREAVGRLLLAGVIGLLVNLPFILWNPHAWLSGVMAPVADPMFPLGTGLINLSIGHLIPYLPEWFYTLLEGSFYAVLLLYYWRNCRKCPEAAMLLAVIPLFFAWRSLPSYFYCAAFPLLALMMSRYVHTTESTPMPITMPTPMLPESSMALSIDGDGL